MLSIPRLILCMGFAAVLLELASCSDSTAPNVSPGTYYLATLDSQPSPFILSDDHFSTGERIVVERLIDSINVKSGTELFRARTDSTTFYAPDGSATGTRQSWGNSGTYRVTNGRMIIQFDIPSPVAAETLEVQRDRVVVGHELVGGWCRSGPPQECPTAPRIREFRYTQH